jgi:hypothetical protein
VISRRRAAHGLVRPIRWDQIDNFHAGTVLRNADLEPAPSVPLTDDQRAILNKIKELYRRREPLNIAAMKRRQPKLLSRVYAIRPFWGWKRALEDGGIDYSKIEVELLDTVRCQICGDERAFLAHHLMKYHGTTPEEYRDEFPGAELTSETLRADNSARQRDRKTRVPHWEPLWSAEYLLDRLAEFHRRGFPLNLGWIEQHEKALPRVAEKFFESWDEVLLRIGLDPAGIRLQAPASGLTKQDVLSELRLRQKQRLSLTFKVVRKDDKALLNAAQRFFGKYYDALRAAGIDPKLVRLNSDGLSEPEAQRILAAIRRLASMKKSKQRKAWFDLKAKYRAQVVRQRRFRSWGKVFAEAGVDPKEFFGTRPKRYPDRKAVITGILERHRHGLSTRSEAVRHDDSALGAAVQEHFGDFAAMHSALRIQPPPPRPRTYRPPRYPDRKATIAGLRRWAAKGLRITSLSLVEKEPSLQLAVRRHLGGMEGAYRALDLPDPRAPRFANREAVIAAVRAHATKARPLTCRKFCESKPGLYEAIFKHLGGTKGFYKLLGISKLIHLRFPDPASVLIEIRRRRAKGLRLNADAIVREDRTLYKWAKHYFGTYGAAVEKA